MTNMANSLVGYNSSPVAAGLLCKVGSALVAAIARLENIQKK